MIDYIMSIMGNDANVDAAKNKINPSLWKAMKISAMGKNQKIHEWLSDAIREKLLQERKNEDK